MVSVDYAALADRLGLDLDEVLEVVALGLDLPALADDTPTTRTVLAAVDLERSRAQRAPAETDAELRFAEEYAERWSG